MRVVAEKQLPFALKVPNAETRAGTHADAIAVSLTIAPCPLYNLPQHNAHPNTMPTATNATRRHTSLASLFATCLLLAAPHAMAQTGDAQYFTEVAPGVVKDSRTGLEWMRCSLGQQWSVTANTCTGEVKKFNWQGAQDIAKKFNSMGGNGGKADWRVPTIRELQSIRYCSKGFTTGMQNLQDGRVKVPANCNSGSTQPTIDLATFPSTSLTLYWSSTPYADDSSYAWFVLFGFGDISSVGVSRSFNYAVRLVR